MLSDAEIDRLDIAGLDDIAYASYEAILAQAREANALRAEVADWRESAKRAAGEMCGDEKHCTCVPLLRATTARLAEAAKLADEAMPFLVNQLTRLEAHGAGDMRYGRWLERYAALQPAPDAQQGER